MNSTYNGESYVNPYPSLTHESAGYSDAMFHDARRALYADSELDEFSPRYAEGYRRAVRDIRDYLARGAR